MNAQPFILLITGLSLLPFAVWVWRNAQNRIESYWFGVGAVSAAAYLSAIALIEIVPLDHGALWATRLAYLGPGVGLPAMILLFFQILSGQTARKWIPLGLFTSSVAIHALAISGATVVRSIDRTTVPPSFTYGPLAVVPLIFDAGMMVCLAAVVIRKWPAASWRARNRFLVFIVSLIGFTFLTITTDLVLPILFGDNRFYLVGPALLFVPVCVGAWVITGERLPDILGFLGKIFPNARSRFLETLRDLEANVSEFSSAEALLTNLSGLTDGRLAFVTDGGALMYPPEASDYLYEPEDRRRIENLVNQVSREVPVATTNAFAVVTGWLEPGQPSVPSPVPWMVTSGAELETTKRLTRALSAEPVVILTVQPGDSPDCERLSGQINRRTVFTTELYPDIEGGRKEAIRLLKDEKDLNDLLIVLLIPEQARADHLETAVSACVSDGAKLLIVTAMERNDLLGAGLFSGSDIDLQESPQFHFASHLRTPSGVSAQTDLFLAQLEKNYGVTFHLTPEERTWFCNQQWQSDQQLEFELEKHVLTARFSPAGGQKRVFA